MSERNDGGPAFPERYLPNSESSSYPGMSLRDWFAGQVVGRCWRAAVRQQDSATTHYVAVAQRAAVWAYTMADAMLAERSK